MTNNRNKPIKPKKILGIETFSYSKNKLKTDIKGYWREIYWKDNKYLNRYEDIYKNTQ